MKRIIVLLALMVLPFLSYSTHIVGGVLNYTYNGGNVYTITLKLYRDCGSSAASLPGSVTIKVKGNNGANFSPSKDLTINLGTVTSLTASLAPCAQAPSPMPCVQEGVYTKTISLPANTGGYHLYYQVSARNLSLTNINGSCNCIGESFYAYIPDNTNSSNSNSNAVFNLFPPLFVCANQPFSFNHAATDANGDSLVYSLYTPYEDNTAPTFSNNVATFPTVSYLTGYTSTNPLGATPFSLNPASGVLTGTPGTIGQFVVGVKVKEYRNGVFISQTLRDFQFNVLNCPAPPPTLAVSNMTINNGCSVNVIATGITTVSSTWHSIYPGVSGAYNNYLSCTSNCLSTTVTATGTPPPYADFVVCGIATNCLANNICDTFRVYFNPPLSVSVTPGNPALCNGQTSATLSAIGSGGTPPYIYLWNNVNPTQTISVGVGTYNIKLTDGSGCPPAYGSAVVTSYSVPVAVNAGTDKTLCITSPMATINTTITGAGGGIWSGGTGTFSPNNTTTSNLFYTPSASELAAGSVTLVLTTTNSGACPSATDAVILYYSAFSGTVNATTTAVSCYGGTNGSASISMTGGIGPYSFLWNTAPSQSLSTANNLSMGVYSLTITDGIACTLQQTVAISQPSPIAVNSTITNVTCFGALNASINLSAIGGSSPYTFSWSPGSITTASIGGLGAGTYTAKVSDSKSCNLISTFSITQPASLTIVFTSTNISCYNGSNGSINTTISGGTGAYTYSWTSNGATTPNLSGLQAGTYSLTVKDILNCSLTKTITLLQPAMLVLTASVTNETCDNLNNGAITLIGSGGTPAYYFVCQPGSFTVNSISNLSSGTYSLTLNDSKGCSNASVVTVSEPAPLVVSLVNQANVSCFGGSNGSVTANVSGGTAAYSYSWSPGTGTTATLANLSVGTYSLYVSDSKSCSLSTSLTITQPSSLTVNLSQSNVTCNGGSDGMASVAVNGGTSPYNYFWTPSGQSTSSIGGLAVGNFSVLITDAKACSVSLTSSVIQPSPLSIIFTNTNVSCYNGANGAITSTVSGGNASYTYTWSPGNNNSSSIAGLIAGTYTLNILDALNCGFTKTVSLAQPSLISVTTSVTNETCDYLNNGIANAFASGGVGAYTFLWLPTSATSNSIVNVPSGDYTVSVTDANGCTVNSTTTITEPTALSVSVANFIQPTCFGGGNGSANAIGSGGTANYSYTWNPGSINSAGINNLSQGVYTISISDAKACVSQTLFTVTQPSSVTISATVNPVSCYAGNNGSILLSPNGGSAPYTYFWLPGGVTSVSISNVGSANYSVNVTDANGCLSAGNYSISQSSSISIALSSTSVSCFGGSDGSIQSNISGGNAPFTFVWSYGAAITQSLNAVPAGNYTLSVTDNYGCTASKTIAITQAPSLAITYTAVNETCEYLNNGSIAALASGGSGAYSYLWQPVAINSNSIQNLASGSYTILVTDLNGCSINSVVTVSEPAPLVLTFTNTINVSCFGLTDGSSTGLGTGGTPNYSYTWTPAGSNGNVNTNLSQGNYTVSISDANGCLAQNTLSISEPGALNLIPSISNVLCNGGSNGAISISMSGGTAPFTHSLMPGNISGVNFTNLQPGTYSIITHDANACINTATVAITQPINISTSTSYTDASCNTQNGVASIAITSGGIPPYSINWLPSGGTSSVSTNLYAGTYTVAVTDGLGCVSSKIVNINNISAPVVSISSSTNVTCPGGTNGALSATYTGGTGVCTYSWLPSGGTNLNATNLATGIYVIQVTDNAGCIGYATSTMITQPNAISIIVSPTNVSCYAGNNGQASAVISGGTAPYSYSWTPGGINTPSVSGLAANVYTLDIQDANACAQNASFSISEPSAPLAISVSLYSVSCFAGSNGSLSASIVGGTSPYNCVVLPGNISGQTISNLSAGTYTLNTSDSKSCITTSVVSIVEPSQITLTTGVVNSNCGLANGQVSVSANGGNGPFSYSWMPGANTTSASTNLFSGNYSVVVTDANNCSANATQSLLDNPEPLVSISSVTNVSCYSGSNGAAFANVSGGTGPFTYTWIPVGGASSTNNGLSAGTHSVLVTSANACTVVATTPFISEPPQTFITVNVMPATCFGSNNGSAIANVYGGTPTYSYSWQSNASVTGSVSNLSAGSYTVQTLDANSCVTTQSFAISQPTAAITLTLSSVAAKCNGSSDGSATAVVNGGTAPYNYNWMPGNINGQSISNLSAGVYTLTVTDAKACSASATVLVSEPLPITLSINALNSNCSLANGQLSVLANGGTNSYSYAWTPNGGNTVTASNLLAGNYNVTVLDANNCLAQTSVILNDNPAPLISISSTTNVSCFGGNNGAATASVSGGTGPFTFAWLPSGGTNASASGLLSGNYSVMVISANGCTSTSSSTLITEPYIISSNILTTSVSCYNGSNGSAIMMIGGGTPSYSITTPFGVSTSSILSGLSAGNYTLNVNDANLCGQNFTFAIAQPTAPLIVAVVSINNVSCFGLSNGSASAVVNGGTQTYNYNWSPYGGNSNAIYNLTAGSYTLSVTDNNGCGTYTSVSVSQPLQALSAMSTVTNVTCFGGSNGAATIIPSGGTAGYTYLWTSLNNTLSSVSGLTNGNYLVNVTDINNCQTAVSISINQPAMVTGSLISSNASCGLANGSISSQITGGTGPYTYVWQPGTYTTSSITGLTPNTYTLIATDALNCTAVLSASFTNIAGPQLSIPQVKNVSCFGGNNGSASLTINQGTAPFSISWFPMGGSAMVGTALLAGTYTASITDALGCIDSETVSISEPQSLNVSILNIKKVSCYNGNNGSISVIANGGTPSFNYSWTPNHTGSVINNLSAGTYSLNVKDANNCTLAISASVPQPAVLSPSVEVVSDALCYKGTGNASITVLGGEAPYTYTWSSIPSQFGKDLMNVVGGVYTVNVQDVNKCLSKTTVTISQPTQVITNVTKRDTICYGKSDNLVANASGGIGNYYYTWMPGAITNAGTLNISPNSSVIYTVLAFDNNGCSGKDATSNITVYNLASSSVHIEGLDLICPGKSSVIEVVVDGNHGPLVYTWNNNLPAISGLHIVTPSVTTDYIVNVSNACGAMVVDTIHVKINDLPLVNLSADTLFACEPSKINFKDLSQAINTTDPLIAWTWDFGDNTFSGEQNPTHTFTSAGTYSVNLEVATDRGCTNRNATNALIIKIHPKPKPDFSLVSDSLNLPYDKLICINQSTGAVNYYWSFGTEGSSNLVNPQFQMHNLGDQKIELVAFSEFGCSDTTHKYVHTNADIIFPNAFTPNETIASNGYYEVTSLSNDVFFPYTSGVSEYKLQIYNRWGELIFESTDLNIGWDGYYRGNICQAGVYIWKAKIILETGRLFEQTGNLSLIR